MAHVDQHFLPADYRLSMFLCSQGNPARTVARWVSRSEGTVRKWLSGSTPRIPASVRFEALTVPEPITGCLLWTGYTTNWGYGVIYGPKNELAHRWAWAREHGDIPPGMFVCHRCDTPACCNVDHLFLGTPQDNTDDMRKKGRFPSGQFAHQSITIEMANRIREMRGVSPVKISNAVGCSAATVRNVLSGRHWSKELLP